MKPTKLPSGSWRIKVYLGKDENGKRIYQSITKPNKFECIQEAVQIAQHRQEVSRDSANMTLEEAIDKYLTLKSAVLSPATIRGYDTIKRNHLQPEMKMPLRNITDNVAQAAINREAKNAKAKTVKNVYGLLTAVMNQFANRKPVVRIPQEETYEGTVLSIDECKHLIDAVKGDIAEMPILLALFLGLRRSEIMGLTHENWDSDKRLLHVTNAVVFDKGNKQVTKTTKTKKSKRSITVSEYLAQRLDAYTAVGLPFCPIHPSTISKRLTAICEREGIRHVRLHDLRHQNASIMLSLGTPDKYAMERGGWSSTQVMKKIYQHTFDSKRNEVNNEIDKFFNDLVGIKKEETAEN